MKKSLDDAFCQYAIEKNLVNKELVAFPDKQWEAVTRRESLLLKGLISAETYIFVLHHLPLEEIDKNEQNELLDHNFIDYGIENELFDASDVKRSMQETSLAISTREKLLISQMISYETYRDIIAKIISIPAIQGDISAETIIDGGSLGDVATLAISLQIPDQKTTIVDSSLSKLEISDQANIETPAPIRDQSEETLVDMTPGDGLKKEASATMELDKLPEFPANSSDDSAETLVDQVMTDYPQDPIKNKEPKTSEPTLELDYQKQEERFYTPAIGHEAIKERNYLTKAREREELFPDEDGPALSQTLVKNLVDEVTREVHLQTQQLVRGTTEPKINYHRLFSGLFVFVLLFGVIFEWQRFQQIRRLNNEKKHAMDAKDLLQKEKEQEVSNAIRSSTELKNIRELYNDAKSDYKEALKKNGKLSQEVKLLEGSIFKGKEQLIQAKSEIARLEKEKAHLRHELKERQYRSPGYYYYLAEANYRRKKYDMALKLIRKAIDVSRKSPREMSRYYALRALIYGKRKEREKSIIDINKAEKWGEKDGDTLILVARYWYMQKQYKKCRTILDKTIKLKFSNRWEAHLLLGHLYAQQNKKASAYKEWKKALELK